MSQYPLGTNADDSSSPGTDTNTTTTPDPSPTTDSSSSGGTSSSGSNGTIFPGPGNINQDTIIESHMATPIPQVGNEDIEVLKLSIAEPQEPTCGNGLKPLAETPIEDIFGEQPTSEAGQHENIHENAFQQPDDHQTYEMFSSSQSLTDEHSIALGLSQDGDTHAAAGNDASHDSSLFPHETPPSHDVSGASWDSTIVHDHSNDQHIPENSHDQNWVDNVSNSTPDNGFSMQT